MGVSDRGNVAGWCYGVFGVLGMSNHTKGPWLSRGKSDSVHEQSETNPFGRQIFRFADDQGPCDEDLNLILSAPDLLEALEAAEPMMLECMYIGGVTEAGADCLAKVRAAIARARGEA